MDTEQEDTRLAELREALRCAPQAQTEPRTFEIKSSDQSFDLDLSGLNSMQDWTTAQIPSLTTDQITALDLSTISLASPGTGGLYQSGVQPSWSFDNDVIQTAASSKISLTGEDADIEINGESVVSMLRDIRDRLAILRVSEEMEAEWDELRSLREQYDAKLAECREKSAMWKTLKNMPPPEIS